MRVELLHEPADGDAGVLGGRSEVDVGVRQPHELRHVRDAAQLVAEVVEHARHEPRPAGRGGLVHEGRRLGEALALQLLEPARARELLDAEQASRVRGREPAGVIRRCCRDFSVARGHMYICCENSRQQRAP